MNRSVVKLTANRRHPICSSDSLCLAVGLLILPAYLMLAGCGPSLKFEHAYKSECSNNLKRIALALREYHDVYGAFPPACTTGEDGTPMHSWRVLILPYLKERLLYEQYDLSEPWNGPHNLRLLEDEILSHAYYCPARKHGDVTLTSYFAVVGTDTIWSSGKARKIDEVTDPHESTILVVECCGLDVHWAEPRDLHLDTMNVSVNAGDDEGISSNHVWRGAHVAMVDGSVVFVDEEECTPEMLRSMLTISGGERVVLPTSELDTQ